MKKIISMLIVAVLFLPSVFSQEVNLDCDVENEPIDLVYKYIDLSDENLHREGIPVCKKDYDNEELRYSLRSVLKNIPWVRKIFIIIQVYC